MRFKSSLALLIMLAIALGRTRTKQQGKLRSLLAATQTGGAVLLLGEQFYFSNLEAVIHEREAATQMAHSA